MIKRIIKNALPFPVLNIIQKYNRKRIRKKIIENWKLGGCPLPPPHALKQMVIAEYKKKNDANILVETGTFYGDMIEAQRMLFKKIFSIELNEALWQKAVNRFKKYNHITILKGDSAKVLHTIIKSLNESAIFWLDGHYSHGVTSRGEKDCPILEEIDAILRYNNLNHILLIDDARLFNGEGDYPTIENLTKRIKEYGLNYYAEVKDDIIRYVKSNN
jgi:hypothetical protein